jgi:hypothetical protein
MDLKSLIAKMDLIEADDAPAAATPAATPAAATPASTPAAPAATPAAGAAPTAIVPTHFHKGNFGNVMPLMMTEPGVFWWDGPSNSGNQMRGGNGHTIQRWSGNTKNRSAWNPASVDGVYVNGKEVEFPEGVTWETYKTAAATQTGQTATAPKGDDSADVAKLNALSSMLQGKMSAAPATQTGQTKQQNLLPVDPKVKALQDAILAVDPGALPKYGADGRMGTETQTAMANHPDIVAKMKGTAAPTTPAAANDAVQNNRNSSVQTEGIASALLESFGYEVQLDEYDLNQFGTDVGAGLRGLGQGATFGYGDELLAHAKSGLGIEKDYKTALEKEMANTARAKAQASSIKFKDPIFHKEWNPSVYDAGEIAGTVAAPIPGGALMKGGAKAAQALGAGAKVAKAAGVATDIGANFATQHIADKYKTAGDIATTGWSQDQLDTLAATDPKEIQALQTKLKLPATGKLDPATLSAFAKAGVPAKLDQMDEAVITVKTPVTEAEHIVALRNRLEKISEASKTEKAIDVATRATKAGTKTAAEKGSKALADVGKEVEAGAKGATTTAGSDVRQSVSNVGNPTINIGSVAPTQIAQFTLQDIEKLMLDAEKRGVKLGKAQAKKAAETVKAVAAQSPEAAADLTNAITATGEAGAQSWWTKWAKRVGWSTGVLALLGGIGLLVGGHEGDTSTTPTTPTTPATPTTPTTPTTPATPTAPATQTGQTADLEEIIKQMQTLMASHGDDANPSPAWSQAASNAQALIDQAHKANPLQTNADTANAQSAAVQESSDAELARWLKIANIK